MRSRRKSWSASGVPVRKFASSRLRVYFSAHESFAEIDSTSRYMLNSSPSSRPRLVVMYWNVCVCTASSKAWRSRNWRHSGLVSCR